MLPYLFLWVRFLCFIPSINYAKVNLDKLYFNIDRADHHTHKVNKSIFFPQKNVFERKQVQCIHILDLMWKIFWETIDGTEIQHRIYKLRKAVQGDQGVFE